MRLHSRITDGDVTEEMREVGDRFVDARSTVASCFVFVIAPKQKESSLIAMSCNFVANKNN